MRRRPPTWLAVKQARKANALALDAGKSTPYDDSATAEMMAAVDDAARKARLAGWDISDLVAPSVGQLD